jgi:guanine deaminase
LAAAVEHLPADHRPGFVDLHIHFPQTDVIGSPAEGLLPWLENYTFPHESRFADAAYAQDVATVFLDELQRNGVTTALTFCTSHPASVDALMGASQQRGLRMIAGKVLQDRHSPDGVRDDTEQSLIDTEALIQRSGTAKTAWAMPSRRALHPAAPRRSCAVRASWLPRYPSVWIQSHVAENKDEIAGRASCFPIAQLPLDLRRLWPDARARGVCALHPL